MTQHPIDQLLTGWVEDGEPEHYNYKCFPIYFENKEIWRVVGIDSCNAIKVEKRFSDKEQAIKYMELMTCRIVT